MAKKDSTKNPSEGIKSYGGVLFALACAVFAELVFKNVGIFEHYLASAGRVAVLFLTIYIIHRFALESYRRYRPGAKDLTMLGLVTVGSIFIIWIGEYLARAVAEYAGTSILFGESLNVEPLYYAIPFATGALLLQAILGLHFGLVFSLCISLIVGVYFPNQIVLVLYVFVTSLVACLSLSEFRSRSAYIKAGLNVALVGFPFAFTSVLLQPTVVPTDAVITLLGAMFAGVLCAFLAAGITPIIEHLGGYVTDMRLIEMATLDHPLLKELSIQAPGTWNHSMVMGMMVESAADAIGANTILARTGAYFHDIGKTKKPMYFVENKGPGENRHDKLSTSMSALIIRSHVKDGIELARKYNLPKAIEDMIPQHHGTSLIEYFYDKACKEAKENDEDASEVDTSLYTYPGPKPQTREAALLMLADGIEAATRTISDPTLDKVQGLVQKMINKTFASGQLNECELTLIDLHLIAKSFTRVLNGIYHQRIAYAEPAEKVNEKTVEAEKEKTRDGSGKKQERKVERKRERKAGKKDLDSGADDPTKEESTEEDKDSKPAEENLKRLGL